jgi:hypothetical protein
MPYPKIDLSAMFIGLSFLLLLRRGNSLAGLLLDLLYSPSFPDSGFLIDLDHLRGLVRS